MERFLSASCSFMCLRCCTFLSNHPSCVRRSHRSEHEVGRPELLLLQLQQSRSGRRRRRRGLGSAQPSGGHSREAAHCRVPRVGRLPAPLGRRAGEPDPAAELSPGPNRSETFSQPVLLCRSHKQPDGHVKTQTYTSDTAVHSGSCRYGLFTYSHTFMYLDGTEHITG